MPRLALHNEARLLCCRAASPTPTSTSFSCVGEQGAFGIVQNAIPHMRDCFDSFEGARSFMLNTLAGLAWAAHGQHAR